MNDKEKRKAATELSENVMWLIEQVLIKHNIAVLEASKEAIDEATKKEREKVASWMIKNGYATGHGDTTDDLLQELEWQILEGWNRALMNGVKTEREQCAKVCDKLGDEFADANAADCANAIRERTSNEANKA